MSKTKTNGIIMRIIAVVSLILFFIPFNKNDNVIDQFQAIKELISWMTELGSEFISSSDVFLTVGIIGFIIFPIPIIILGCNNRTIGIIVSLVNCVFNVVYSIVFHIELNQYSNDISLSPKLIIISVLSIVIFIIAILNCVLKPTISKSSNLARTIQLKRWERRCLA